MLSWVDHLRPQKIYWTLSKSESNVTGLEIFLSQINNFKFTLFIQEFMEELFSLLQRNKNDHQFKAKAYRKNIIFIT
jgi:hypothetical protein